MASIRKYADKWRVEVYKNGQRHSKLCETRAEAQHWGVQKELELDAIKSQGHTLEAAVELYLQTVTPKKKDSTQKWERHRFGYILDHFGKNTLLGKITSKQIGQWRDQRLKTVAGSTVLRESSLIRNLFTVACDEWGWLEKHPFKGVKLPEHNPPREQVWGWREIRRLLRFCAASPGLKTREVGAMFHIALRTGLRMKEALAAKLEGNVIVLMDTKTTKAGRMVKVPTTTQGRRVMQQYAGIERTQMNANEASTIFHKACVQCGLRQPNEDGPTFHDARATALTHMSRRMPVQVLQRISRHRNINILVNTYYRESAEQIAARL